MAVGDQEVFHAVQECPTSLDVPEELALRIAAPRVHQHGTVIRTNEINCRIFRGGEAPPSHLIDLIRYPMTLSLEHLSTGLAGSTSSEGL
jgi:hypothetical protein